MEKNQIIAMIARVGQVAAAGAATHDDNLIVGLFLDILQSPKGVRDIREALEGIITE